ncbi:lysozyme [Streptomyces iconiensis]|uniref:Lysozyme n=2 Tax=Streptomyces iconiensis TaxID=1384038 RepID=A0ABT6ZW55_9ACTN|nr:lysozyme [Streptomyces iconiensis]MDJ1133062.1 lysozyme [Streptomyces iconiensis]
MARGRQPAVRRTPALTLAAAALALTGTALADRPVQADTTAKPRGHDVSSYQGKVNWKRARTDGARFVYVKATEGTAYKNPHFKQQYGGAGAAGILRGAYHFARADESSGKAQAAHLVRNGGTWRGDGATLPPALDLEAAYGKTCHGLSRAGMRGWIRSFSNEVRRLTGRRPVLYTSTRWWRTCTGDSAAFARTHPLWLADWRGTPGPLPGGWHARALWQYANKGRLPGDQNLFNGTLTQLRKFARG